jgi:hypothetical protein
MKILLIILVLALTVSACVPALIIPSTTDVARANQTDIKVTIGTLNEAHKLYVNKCGSCHFLYRPYQFSKEQWAHLMPDMKEEAKLTDQEYELLLKYVAIMQESVPIKKLNN